MIGLRPAFEEARKGDRAAALLSVVGVVNILIIKYSVATLLAMILGFMLFFAAVLIVRMRAEALHRERGARWTREIASAAGAR